MIGKYPKCYNRYIIKKTIENCDENQIKQNKKKL